MPLLAPPRPARPVGVVTRGTTNPNRLRRADRYLTGPLGPLLRGADDPLVVDLGFGASPTTAVELRDRLRAVRPDVRVLGIEIDPARVAAALPLTGPGLAFRVGGFELPTDGRAPVLVRAFNVLRQYRAEEVEGVWDMVRPRLAPGGVLVDGTCDEIGRRATWVDVGAEGPRSLTVSLRFGAVERPSDVAERLPKVLIHRNVPGERVHAWLAALDAAWLAAAPLASFGRRQRWLRRAGRCGRRAGPCCTGRPGGGSGSSPCGGRPWPPDRPGHQLPGPLGSRPTAGRTSAR